MYKLGRTLLILNLADFAKCVGPTVKSDRNLIGPIKTMFVSYQMSAIVRDRISVLTDARSRFPLISFVPWFPVKVKILIPRLNYFENAVPWKKRRFDTSDGTEYKRNLKYKANRVERTLIEQWKTGRHWLLLSVL